MKATLRDDTLPHQIRLHLSRDGHNLITVGCCCQPGPIEKRPKWEADEALAVWRMHVLDSVPVEEAEASDA